MERNEKSYCSVFVADPNWLGHKTQFCFVWFDENFNPFFYQYFSPPQENSFSFHCTFVEHSHHQAGSRVGNSAGRNPSLAHGHGFEIACYSCRREPDAIRALLFNLYFSTDVVTGTLLQLNIAQQLGTPMVMAKGGRYHGRPLLTILSCKKKLWCSHAG